MEISSSMCKHICWWLHQEYCHASLLWLKVPCMAKLLMLIPLEKPIQLNEGTGIGRYTSFELYKEKKLKKRVCQISRDAPPDILIPYFLREILLAERTVKATMSSGGQRRSLRILELEVRKAQELNKKKHDMSSGSIEDQYSQRQRRKKSKVNHASSNKSAKTVEAVEMSTDTPLPQMSAMVLLLDILKRRDAYKIFAEPVNAAEVKGYDDVVKKPMDFATISKKLSKGEYKKLEDFEGDVFLVFSNAMLFNPSNTVYYRQARVIREVAKKLFIALRADASYFENEFALARLASDRWTKAEARLLNSKESNQSKKSMTAGKESTVEGKSKVLLQQQKTYNPRTFYPSGNEAPAPTVFSARDSQKAPAQINQSYLSYGQNVSQLSNFTGSWGPAAAQMVAKPTYEKYDHGAFGLWGAPSDHRLPVFNRRQVPGTAFQGGGLHPSIYPNLLGRHANVFNQKENAPSNGPYSGNPSTSHGGNQSIFDGMSLDDFLKYLMSL